MPTTLAVVGRGRLGSSLAPLLARAGHAVHVLAHDEVERISPDVDLVLLCVPDDAITSIAARVPLGPVIVHCAGSRDLDVLAPHAPERRGSLHPLMTFPGPALGVPDLHGVPAAVAGGADALPAILALAADLGLDAVHVPGDRRLYHAAAVMAGNFATILLAEAATVLAAAGVPPERAPALLAPLAIASIRNAGSASDPWKALTGPLARGDRATIDAHRHALGAAHLDGPASLYDTFVKHADQRRPLPNRGGRVPNGEDPP